VLSVSALECARGERKLFGNLGFSVAPHTLLEIRGVNGSGKSTLLRALCGLLEPAAGNIAWNNTNIRALGDAYRSQITYLGHVNAIHDDLTAIENLRFSAQLAGMTSDAADEAQALQWMGLSAYLRQPCKTLSQGQRRRVALAHLRLAAAKPLWILDEPFNALDSAAIDLVQSALAAHLSVGGMVILTTHQALDVAAGQTLRIELGT
jgi:heme exporter protein A